MLTFVTILFVFTAFLLIAVVLIQQPKSAGGGLFAGTGQSLLGTSGKTFWTKFTTVLAVVFMMLCLLLSALPRYQNQGSAVTDIIEKQQQQAAPPPATNPPPQTLPNQPSNSVPQGAGAPKSPSSVPSNSVTSKK